MKKRILIFSFTYLPKYIGGAEIAVKEITERLSNEYDFDMVSISDLGDRVEQVGVVKVYKVGSFGISEGKISPIAKLLYVPQAFLKARVLLRNNKYDAFWSIMANRAGFVALFCKLLNPKIPFILTLQEGDPIEYVKERMGVLWYILKNVFRMIFSKADVIQVISNYLSNFAKEAGARKGLEPVVIPNAVNYRFFSKASIEDVDRIKRELNKRDDDVFIVTTSRLVTKNAVGDVIKALSYLPEKFKFIVLGTGALENELKNLVKSLSLESRVKFLGNINHADIPAYLKASDIFIRPSLSEGFGNSFIEAMASGIPVIATPVGGIVDFLKDEVTGLSVRVSDSKDISEKILKIINDEHLRNTVIHNARHMVERDYDWSKISKDMDEKVFKIVLK